MASVVWRGAQLDQLLLDRLTAVCLHDGVQSAHEFIKFGVPQGSVLKQQLFVLYTADLAPLIAEHRLHSHLYADDMQVYGWCQPTDVSLLQANMSRCFDDVWRWMCSNRLQMNALKTSSSGALLITFLIETSKSGTTLTIRSSQPETLVCTSTVV